jgi:hypothetical protein
MATTLAVVVLQDKGQILAYRRIHHNKSEIAMSERSCHRYAISD